MTPPPASVTPLSSAIDLEPSVTAAAIPTTNGYHTPKHRQSFHVPSSLPSDAFVPDESTWHSVPLAFALLPAIGGVIWTDANLVITDVLLLGLTAVFLHWLVKFPWEWYHASRTIPGGDPSLLLRRDEHLSLATCFLGPLIGGWLLHAIRTQLSRPSTGLVSDFNLTIFVLAAELRPAAQVVKLVRLRSAYLQSQAHRPPARLVEDLLARVERLEKAGGGERVERAVRRLERRGSAYEQRIGDLEVRLGDVLTFAAAVERRVGRGEEARGGGGGGGGIWGLVLFPWMVGWKIVTFPKWALEMVVNSAEGRRVESRRRDRRGIRST